MAVAGLMQLKKTRDNSQSLNQLTLLNRSSWRYPVKAVILFFRFCQRDIVLNQFTHRFRILSMA